MEKFRKNLRVASLAIIAIIILVVISMIVNPIRRTNSGVRRHLLLSTPIGTNIEEVIRVSEENAKLTIRYVRENAGVVLLKPNLSPTNFLPNSIRDTIVVGEKSICIYLGTFNFITRISVEAFFAFDESDELIEIFIRRYYDFP